MKRSMLAYVAIIVIGLIFCYIIYSKGNSDYQSAIEQYKESSSRQSHTIALNINADLNNIYQNLRTISLLPSVKSIDRHATNLSSDARASIQQIYNNLNSNLTLSEIYIVPVSFNPQAVDPETKKLEEPSLMFDDNIADSPSDETGPKLEEIESYEYSLLTQQMQLLSSTYPNNLGMKMTDIPMLSGKKVITCDNSQYKASLKDRDRTGMLFSVPFYTPENKLSGTITAIILDNVLRARLPQDNATSKTYGLINPGYEYEVANNDSDDTNPYSIWMKSAKPNTDVIYSEVIELKTKDKKNPWYLWVSYDNANFFDSEAAKSVRNFLLVGYSLCLLFVILCIAAIAKSQRTLNLIKLHNAKLENDLKDRIDEIEILAKERASVQKKLEMEKQASLQSMANNFEKSMQALVEQVDNSASEVQEAIGGVKHLVQDTIKRSEVVSIASAEASNRAIGVKDTIFKLADKSKKIGDIIQAITSIAKKINLLAMNATIEAARAGEAGKGFAVVASEVKNLADQVTRETAEIKGQIDDIQSSTNASVDAVMSILGIIDPAYAQNEEHNSISENIIFVQESASKTENTTINLAASAQQLTTISNNLRGCMNELLETIRLA